MEFYLAGEITQVKGVNTLGPLCLWQCFVVVAYFGFDCGEFYAQDALLEKFHDAIARPQCTLGLNKGCPPSPDPQFF